MKAQRLVGLDVFRGVTIAGMILVSNAGDWDHEYAPLKHAVWDGCTACDLIFPFFLFIVGTAMAFSMAKHVEPPRGEARAGTPAPRSKLYLRILRRALILVALGVVPALLPHLPFAQHLVNILFPGGPEGRVRIPGVLQRIGLVYFVVAVLVLNVKPVVQMVLGGAILAGYAWLSSHVRAPDGPADAPPLSMEGCLVGYVDRVVFGREHLIQPTNGFDPEGLLSSLPALVTTLLGYWTGLFLRRAMRLGVWATPSLLFAGLVCVAGGALWRHWLPLNKQLWSSSYVLYTGGWALVFLAACHELVDVRHWSRWSLPFEVLGHNAILVYVLSVQGERVLNRNTHFGSIQIPPRMWLTEHLFAPWLSPNNASLAYALCVVAFWIGIAYLLHRKRWYLRV